MPASNFDLDSLTRDENLVAAALPADAVFGVLNRALDLPPYWAALVITKHGEKIAYPAGGEVPGEDVEEITLIRDTPLGLQFEFDQILSRDGFPCDVSVVFEVRVTTEQADMTAFRERIVGGRSDVRIADLASGLDTTIREATREYVAKGSASELLGSSAGAALADAVRSKLSAEFFSTGLTAVGFKSCVIDSKSYRQFEQQQKALERRKDRRSARAQLQQAARDAQDAHAAHLVELLQRLKALDEDSPHAGMGDLLRTFDEAQRGELYQALWAAPEAERSTRSIVVACGEELLFFDPDLLERPASSVDLSGPAGGLRSVSRATDAQGRGLLMVGAACGIHTLDPTSGSAQRTYLVPPDSESQNAGIRGGFNAAALAGEYLFATHSEVGLCRWHIDRPGEYVLLVPDLSRDARAVRHAQFAGGAVWLSVDCNAFALPPAIAMGSGEDSEGSAEIASYSGSRTAITALALTEEHVFAGNAGGEVLRWDTDQRTDPTVIYRGNRRPVEGITLLPAFGVDRLFFTDTSASLHAQVVGDAFTCRYQAGGQTIRRAEVAPDLVVATNETRDRLFCWPTASPSSAPSVVMVSQITGRSIQDFCLSVDTAPPS